MLVWEELSDRPTRTKQNKKLIDQKNLKSLTTLKLTMRMAERPSLGLLLFLLVLLDN